MSNIVSTFVHEHLDRCQVLRISMISVAEGLVYIIVSFILYQCYGAFFGQTSRYPGPLLAKFTNVWRFMDTRIGNHHETLRRLHKAHGSIVRIGPDLLSLSDPRWTKILYSTKGEFKKTKAYSVNDVNLGKGAIVPTTFSVQGKRRLKIHATGSRYQRF